MLKKIVLAFIFILLTAGIALGVFFYGSLKQVTVHSQYAPTPTPIPKIEGFNGLQPLNILLMGYGGGGHQGGLLTDTMMLVSIQPQQKQIFLISIPRDLWVQIPAKASAPNYFKINAAYAIGADDRGYPNKSPQYTGAAGGGELAKYVAGQVTGMTINNFVTVDFSGFEKTINTLGGVNVHVDRTFEDPYYPIDGQEENTCGKSDTEIAALSATMSGDVLNQQFSCRYEDLKFKAGTTFMDGATALKYVRSRHSTQDGGDFNRGARQRNLLVAVKDKVLAIDFISKILPFTASLSRDLTMDISLEQIQEFLKYKDDVTKYQLVNLALTQDNVLTISTSSDRQSIVIPREGIGNYTGLQSWLQYNMTATVAAQLAASSSAQDVPQATTSKPLKTAPLIFATSSAKVK